MRHANEKTLLLEQNQSWDHIIAIVGGQVEVFLEFDQKSSDRVPFNNYIREQSTVVSCSESNVYEKKVCGAGVWFGTVVDEEAEVAKAAEADAAARAAAGAAAVANESATSNEGGDHTDAEQDSIQKLCNPKDYVQGTTRWNSE